MSLLLDTHAALWYFLGDKQLSTSARKSIEDETDQIYVSPASYWEIAIKISLKKYSLGLPFTTFWQRLLLNSGFTILPVEIRHAEEVAALPMIHRDPFDRLIIAQAIVEGIPIISNDTMFDSYNITRLW